MVAGPFQMSFLLLIRVSGPGLLFLPSSTPPGRVGGCCPCRKPMEWHMVSSGSVQLLSGHILRGFILSSCIGGGLPEERLFHLAELSMGEMDEKRRGRKGHPPGPLEATVRMPSCSTCTLPLKHQESENLCSFSPGSWTPSSLSSTIS